MDIRLAVVALLIIYISVEIHGNDERQGRKPRKGRVWSRWHKCTVSCGKGWQSRICLNSGATCNGHITERRMCNVQPCPVPEVGKWSEWQPYSPCERVATIDDECMGFKRRVRKCIGLQSGGKYCTGCDSEIKPCPLC
ncbi:thrombospondin-2-like [Pecten maximus]|uniref:thrombospondin-2-like n=1 Tax=Pecten maximus TaxID=6579 RepID=UPI001458286E|nr:thrombospondin-2-like [Pecten maximus]